MSELVHVVVAGPTLKKLTPAPTTSANGFAPDGVVPSRGGPFAKMIGNAGAPFNTTVPLGSSVVTPAAAIPAQASANTSATGQMKRFSANPDSPERQRADSTEPTAAPDLQQWAERPTSAGRRRTMLVRSGSSVFSSTPGPSIPVPLYERLGYERLSMRMRRRL